MFDPRYEEKLFAFYRQFCCLKKQVDESAGGFSIENVDNYSSLPSASDNPDTFYLVLNSQGTWWLPGSLGGDFYSKGLYYSNGTSWIFAGDIPYQATQLEVNAGVINDKFVTPLTLNSFSKWLTKSDVGHTHPQSDIVNLISDLAAKQDALVSGTNIKTINGNSILGSGDLVVSGGSSSEWGQLSFSALGTVTSVSGGVDTLITFNTTAGSGTTLTTSSVQVLTAGNYSIDYNINAVPTAAGAYELRLYINGSEHQPGRAMHRKTSIGFHTSIGNSIILNLAANDLVRLYFRCNAGVSMGSGNAVLKVIKIP